jgi:hypothetical protein
VKLGHAQRPQDIAGYVKLNPLVKLSEYFSSPPYMHVHIVVKLPSPPVSTLVISLFACLPEQCATPYISQTFHAVPFPRFPFVRSLFNVHPSCYHGPIRTIPFLVHIPQDIPSVLLNIPVWKTCARLVMRLEQHRCNPQVCPVSAPFNGSEHVLR